jgi:hypothetical protein
MDLVVAELPILSHDQSDCLLFAYTVDTADGRRVPVAVQDEQGIWGPWLCRSVLGRHVWLCDSAVCHLVEKSVMQNQPVFFPNGIASPDESIGFTSHHGQIIAIQLDRGKILWQSNAASVPLAATPDRLIAQRISGNSHVMHVVTLDVGTGKPIEDDQAVEFPEWVSTNHGDPGAF